MKIESQAHIAYPRELVYATYRDELPEIVQLVRTIRKVECDRRDPVDDGVKLHNIWHANGKIPRIARGFIKSEMLMWDEDIHWQDGQFVADWNIKTRFFRKHFKCTGRNSFHEDGEGKTRVQINGELTIDLKGIKGVPRLLRPRFEKQVEKFIVMLITPNLARVNQALGEYLDSKG